jgi:protein-tyrosine-phosphatase
MRNQRFEVFSGGAHPLSMPEEAVQVMQEIGTDSMPRPATAITDYTGQSFDYVITVCDHVRDTHIPVEVTGRRLHWGYRDLNTLPDSETRLQVFREAAQHFQTRISYFMEEV